MSLADLPSISVSPNRTADATPNALRGGSIYTPPLDGADAPQALTRERMFEAAYERIGEPCSELGVTLFFGMVMTLEFERVESGNGKFPDLFMVGYDGQTYRVELEKESKNFLAHKHDPDGCDLIVCWRRSDVDIRNSLDLVVPVWALEDDWFPEWDRQLMRELAVSRLIDGTLSERTLDAMRHRGQDSTGMKNG